MDSRLTYSLYLKFDEPFFKRGDFPPIVQNDTDFISTPNPWKDGTKNVAPFDQPFYLIMNVAVGGTNGWFPDGAGDKPWLDHSLSTCRVFFPSLGSGSPGDADDGVLQLRCATSPMLRRNGTIPGRRTSQTAQWSSTPSRCGSAAKRTLSRQPPRDISTSPGVVLSIYFRRTVAAVDTSYGVLA